MSPFMFGSYKNSCFTSKEKLYIKQHASKELSGWQQFFPYVCLYQHKNILIEVRFGQNCSGSEHQQLFSENVAKAYSELFDSSCESSSSHSFDSEGLVS